MTSELPWAWRADQPASPDDLSALQDVAPIPLPKSYIDLLRQADGYEGSLSVEPFNLVLSPAREVINDVVSGTFTEFFPDFFVIGGNGGGDAIAFDTRTDREGWVLSFDMTNIDLAESVRDVAPNFDELLTKIEA